MYYCCHGLKLSVRKSKGLNNKTKQLKVMIDELIKLKESMSDLEFQIFLIFTITDRNLYNYVIAMILKEPIELIDSAIDNLTEKGLLIEKEKYNTKYYQK